MEELRSCGEVEVIEATKLKIFTALPLRGRVC